MKRQLEGRASKEERPIKLRKVLIQGDIEKAKRLMYEMSNEEISSAASPSLHTIDMNNTQLGKHGPEVAKALATSPSLHTVDMSRNKLSAHGPEVAKALASLLSLRTIDMSWNELGEHDPEVAKVFKDHNSNVDAHNYSLFIGKYGLLEHGFPSELVDLITLGNAEHHIDWVLFE